MIWPPGQPRLNWVLEKGQQIVKPADIMLMTLPSANPYSNTPFGMARVLFLNIIVEHSCGYVSEKCRIIYNGKLHERSRNCLNVYLINSICKSFFFNINLFNFSAVYLDASYG